MIKFNDYTVLTFDCYGTLVDWENGILGALKPVLARHRVSADDDELLELYAKFESRAEDGPYIPYREVLRSVIWQFGKRFGFAPRAEDDFSIADSIKEWQPFPDTVDALQALKKRYELAIISNIDDDLFTGTARKLRVEFDCIITSQQVQNYKPSIRNFTFAVEKIGVPEEQILHVGQSLYHDIAPAKAIGLATAWVNRRLAKKGSGATLPVDATPDLEVPDLKSLVMHIGL